MIWRWWWGWWLGRVVVGVGGAGGRRAGRGVWGTYIQGITMLFLLYLCNTFKTPAGVNHTRGSRDALPCGFCEGCQQQWFWWSGAGLGASLACFDMQFVFSHAHLASVGCFAFICIVCWVGPSLRQMVCWPRRLRKRAFGLWPLCVARWSTGCWNVWLRVCANSN